MDKKIDLPSDAEFIKGITDNIPTSNKPAQHMYEAIGAAIVIGKVVKNVKKRHK